jgi:hypothetical protein
LQENEDEGQEEEEALAPPESPIDRRGQSLSPPLIDTALRDPFLSSSLTERIQIETFSILESFVINTQSHIELHRKE